MKEMLLVGRGGEGVVLASQILAETFGSAGYYAQGFPEFKAERRGAPISAFLRWDEAPIHRRYKVRDCDVLLVVSPGPPPAGTLLRVRPGGLVVLNAEERFRQAGPFRVARAPAARIARRHGILSSEGRPMGNMALLGAAVRLLLPDGLAFLEDAIGSRMGARGEANLVAAREGYARCTRQHAVAGDAPVEAPPAAAETWTAPLYPVSTTGSRHLLIGSWSLDRPVLAEACTACGVCALFCPDGAMTREGGTMAVDFDHCKGCGICEVVCPVRGAIAMEAVA